MPDLLNQIGTDGEIREDLAESWGITDLRFYNRTQSTQEIARALSDAGAPSWTLIVADHQTSGRGRSGGTWLSQPGSSVMFSLVIRPERPEALSLLPIRIGLILARTLDELLLTRGSVTEEEMPLVGLKWPNDLVIGNGKVGGILVEGISRGTEQAIIIGVGLNVLRMTDLPERNPSELPFRYLDDYLIGKANRLRILERVVTALREQLRTVPEDLMPREIEEYAARDWLLGRRIVGPAEGEVVGINRKGFLLVESEEEDREIETVISGSVRLAPDQEDGERFEPTEQDRDSG